MSKRYLKIVYRTGRCGHKQEEYISYNRVKERIAEEERIAKSQKFCIWCEKDIVEKIRNGE